MYKKAIVILIFLALSTALSAESKVIPMPELMKPHNIFFDKTRMYVTEYTNVYIYSLKDFKMIGKFGKKGEGPQEFLLDPTMPGLYVSKQGSDLMIQSFGKISWFTTDGTYKNEIKMPNPYMLFTQALGNNIAARRLILGRERWQALTIFDKSFKKIKEIYRVKHLFQPGKGTHVLGLTPPAFVYKNKLYVVPDNSFTIKVYDQSGNQLYVIQREEKKRPVNAKDKKKIMNFYKTSPLSKDYLQFMKPFHFPEHFPAIKGIAVGDEKIFVVTNHQNKAGRQECLIMDLKGKLLKRTHVHMTDSGILQLSPFTIHKGAVHQLTENEEKEEWRLTITKVL
ncbi:MAG: hypothetical protein GY950_32265 [bacterium]|nr:hypothetical protein [bacterium]